MTTPMFDLTGKVAIITGSTKGIGKAIARQMARSGAKVVISSRKADACDSVTEEIIAEGGTAVSIPCHIGDKAQLQALVDKTLAQYGRIDILVCNAATNPTYGPLSEIPDGALDKILDVNVKGAVWLCNMALPHIEKQKGGSVILISSIAGLRGSATIGAYGMSKAAEAALARNLALEWGPRGVRVNAIAPGLIATDFAKALTEDPVRRERAATRTPLRRIGEPDDIAGVAHFLASDAAAYVTGQVIVADGGEMVSS